MSKDAAACILKAQSFVSLGRYAEALDEALLATTLNRDRSL